MSDTIIFSCSCGSDVGELADKATRKLAKTGKAKMGALASIGAKIQPVIDKTKLEKRVIALDGCPVCCAKKILENAGIKVESVNMKDFGFEKGKTVVNEESVDNVILKLKL